MARRRNNRYVGYAAWGASAGGLPLDVAILRGDAAPGVAPASVVVSSNLRRALQVGRVLFSPRLPSGWRRGSNGQPA